MAVTIFWSRQVSLDSRRKGVGLVAKDQAWKGYQQRAIYFALETSTDGDVCLARPRRL